MMEWKEVRLGDLCRRVCSGGTPKSTNSSFYEGGSIPWLNTKEVDFSYIYHTEKYITEEGLHSSSAKWIPANCVVVAMYGATAGKIAVNKIPLTTNQACCNLEIDSEIADYQYIYFYLCSKYTELASMANGGAQQNLNAQIIKDFSVPLPSLSEQKRIAAILSSLDDKIENNRRINKNLEEQAQALFKSWFVDFEPFKDGEFVDSELGLIPKGWKVGKLGELVELLNGFAFKSNSFEEGGLYRIITIKGVQDGALVVDGADSISEIPAKMPRWCSLQIGDVLLSLTGNVGRCCLVDENNLLLNQRVAKLKPLNPADKLFTYIYFRLDSTKYMLENISKGTAQANLSPVETSKQLIVIPPRKVLDVFAKHNCIIEQILENNQESRRLAQLRDTLLPKLMNGEIEA